MVFVHGACENSSFWKSQVEALQKQHHLIMLDLPGHGQSAKPSQEASIALYAEIVRDALRGLELTHPILSGHSMGGAIALTLVVEHPKLLSGVVLANTGAKLGVLPEILAGLETDYSETIRNIVAPRELGNEYADHLLEWISNEMVLTDPAVGFEDFMACRSFDLRARIKEIHVPTLIVSGDQDQLTPLKWSVYLNENIPDSELAVIQRTGHLTMLERPEAFNRVLEEFFSEHSI